MFVIWLAMLAACDDTTFNSHSVEVDGEGIEGVTQVFDGNCVECHSGEAASAGLDLEGDFCDAIVEVEAASGAGVLVVPGSREESILYQRLVDGDRPMPPTGVMSQSNTDLVGQWIDDGADCSGASGDDDGGGDDGGGDDGGGSGTGADAAANDVLQPNCAGCHSDAGQAGGFSLATDLCDQLVNQTGNTGAPLVVPGDADSSLLYQRMTDVDDPMPQSGLLPQADADVVKDWINAGAECGDVVSDTGASVDGGISE